EKTDGTEVTHALAIRTLALGGFRPEDQSEGSSPVPRAATEKARAAKRESARPDWSDRSTGPGPDAPPGPHPGLPADLLPLAGPLHAAPRAFGQGLLLQPGPRDRDVQRRLADRRRGVDPRLLDAARAAVRGAAERGAPSSAEQNARASRLTTM